MSKRAGNRSSRFRSLPLLVVLGGVVLAALLIWLGRPASAPSTLPDQETAGIPLAGTTAGWDEAPVKVELFSDFQCIHCMTAATRTLPPLLENEVRERQVQVTYRFYPALGPGSQDAAEAAFCAAEQNQFWPYHDRLYADLGRRQSGASTQERLRAHAEAVGLDLDAWEQCLNAQAVQERIRDDVARALQFGIRGTPTFLVQVDGKLSRVEGAVPYAELQQAIARVLGERPGGE